MFGKNKIKKFRYRKGLHCDAVGRENIGIDAKTAARGARGRWPRRQVRPGENASSYFWAEVIFGFYEKKQKLKNIA